MLIRTDSDDLDGEQDARGLRHKKTMVPFPGRCYRRQRFCAAALRFLGGFPRRHDGTGGLAAAALAWLSRSEGCRIPHTCISEPGGTNFWQN